MILGFLRSLLLNIGKLVLFVIGLPVVWFALPYRYFVFEKFDGVTFTQHPQHGAWYLVRLPRWALWWDNPYDGMLGDKRGWWANYCMETYGKPHTDRYCMWRWAALRNPCNYYSRKIAGVDVSQVIVQQVGGNIGYEGKPPYRGWFLLRAKHQDGRIFPRFYLEWAIKGAHGLMIDIGYKVKLSHNGTPPDAPEKDRFKGIVATVSFWKELS